MALQTDDEISTRFPECKYLGRIILDGPTNARPHKTALQAMIETIEKNAPGKNKRRLRFEIQSLRPVIPDVRGRVDRQTKDTFVAYEGGKGGDEEVFRVAFADIVSIGSWRRAFCFITLDQTNKASTRSPDDSTEKHVQFGKFYVQAFKFSSAAEASAASQNLIKAVERSRIKDMQIFLKNRQAKIKNGWTAPANRAAVEDVTGRNALMSPLPEEVPVHIEKAAESGEGLHGEYADRPGFLSPLPPAGVGVVAPKPRLLAEIQRTLDSHELSPQAEDQRSEETTKVATRSHHSRPSRGRASDLQQQLAAALTSAQGSREDTSGGDGAHSSVVAQAEPKATEVAAGSASQQTKGSDEDSNVPLVTVNSDSPDHSASSSSAEQSPEASPEQSPEQAKKRSPEHLRVTRLKSPAESGYHSEAGSSGAGSNTSLLSDKSPETVVRKVVMEQDEGLTPSPLVSRGSKQQQHSANRKLLDDAAATRSVSIV